MIWKMRNKKTKGAGGQLANADVELSAFGKIKLALKILNE